MSSEGRFLAVDLHHVLDLLGDRAIASRWRASGVWAIGQESSNSAEELERLAVSQTFITGSHLSHLAHGIRQVIDGEFLGFNGGDHPPWVIVRAVDSTFYEVFSPEATVLDLVRASFQNVSDCEYVA